MIINKEVLDIGGRPTNYTPELVQKATDYVSDDPEKNYLSYDHAIPSVVGLCRVLNRARSTLYAWGDDKSKSFSDILRAVNEFQELTVLNGTLKNQLNAQIGKLVLGKHGYHEKQDTALSGPGGDAIQVDNKWTIEVVDKDA